MRFAIPYHNVFWLPMPYNGQSRMDLVDFVFDKSKSPKTIDLVNPENDKNYTVEILDFMGPYTIDKLPNHIVRTIGGVKMTGSLFAKFLIKRLPEFRNVKEIIFYQVNPL